MNICQRHWDKLRAAIDARGLSALISESGEQAAKKTVSALNGEQTIDSFDPLMNAHWAIAANAMRFIRDVGGNPLAVMSGGEADHEKCSICYLNWMMDEHDRLCEDPDCQKPKGEAAHYDWMIDRAADDQVQEWKDLAL